jgi:PAS domain-containing protein
MQSASRSRFSIYSSRLHQRRPLDVRVCLLAIDANGEWLRLYGRTRDLSLSGACLTLPCMLPHGSEVALQLRLPQGESFAVRAIVIRRQGSRLGVRFLETSAAQRLMLAAYCRG